MNISNIIKKRYLILLIFPLILLSGCGTTFVSAVTTTTQQAPTTVQVRRVNLIPGNHYLPFSPRTITDQQVVQRLYNAMQALPHWDLSGPVSCPNDAGLEYQLDFFQEHTFIQEVVFDPEGCSTVRIGKNDVRVPDKSFTQLFVQTLGISETELAPLPLFSCTPHSPCPSPTP
ncbi:MAG: hypothetical protein ACYDER_22265 [Ktedonobacteraceae bacterium]